MSTNDWRSNAPIPLPSPSDAPHAHNCASIEQGRPACDCAPSPFPGATPLCACGCGRALVDSDGPSGYAHPCAPSPGATTPLTLSETDRVERLALAWVDSDATIDEDPMQCIDEMIAAIPPMARELRSLRRLRADEEGRAPAAIFEALFERGPDSFNRAERETIRQAIEQAWHAGYAARAPLPDGRDATRVATLDLLVDVWCQFALPVSRHEPAMSDGGLSVLEDVAGVLVAAGRLRSAGVEGMDWYVLAPAPRATDDNGTAASSTTESEATPLRGEVIGNSERALDRLPASSPLARCPADATGNPVDCGGCAEHAAPAQETETRCGHPAASVTEYRDGHKRCSACAALWYGDENGGWRSAAPRDPGSHERTARPGELCRCGRPAVTVYRTELYGDVPSCGIPDGGRGDAHRKQPPRAPAPSAAPDTGPKGGAA